MKDANLITSGSTAIGPGDAVLLGAPWDEGSSYLKGAAQAPARIAVTMLSAARNLACESGIDLGSDRRFHVLGELTLAAGQGGLEALERQVESILEAGAHPLVLGGDHSISAAILRPVGRHFPGLTLVQIDAHPDLYDEFEGDRESHACPMARIMEEGRVGRLVQVGIRASTPHQAEQAERFGVECLPEGRWSAAGLDALDIDGPVYLTLDLDGLDPAFAPGVSHPEPGGPSSRQVIDIIQNLPGQLIGADLVELNPLRDTGDLTAIVAAKLAKEMLAKMLQGEQG